MSRSARTTPPATNSDHLNLARHHRLARRRRTGSRRVTERAGLTPCLVFAALHPLVVDWPNRRGTPTSASSLRSRLATERSLLRGAAVP